MKIKGIVSTTKEVLREFAAIEPYTLAASLSYYTLLSLAPLLLVVVSVAGLAFGREAVQGEIVAQMQGLMGRAGAEVLQTVIENAHAPERGTISLVIGIFTLLLGATTVFVQLQAALNRIWKVHADKEKKSGNMLLRFVRDRLLSLAMVLGVGFLLLVSLVVSAGIAAFGKWAETRMTLSPVFWQALDAGVSVVLITLLLAMIFKWLPDAEIDWGDVWFGSVATALFFVVGKTLIGIYLGRASVGSAFGAAGSVVVLLVWIYYASLILFLGAELTHVHTRQRRGEPPPVEYAARGDARAENQEICEQPGPRTHHPHRA